MQTLFLLEPELRRIQTDLQTIDRGPKTNSVLVGSVLADRYKILESGNPDALKAHDLWLDQAVTLRALPPMSPRDRERWEQVVEQLSTLRDNNFLNVIDFVRGEADDFVVSERSRGKSITELLSAGSHFVLREVLALITPLTGALDLAARFSSDPNVISTDCLFTKTIISPRSDGQRRSLSGFSPFSLQVDLWTVIGPRKSLTPVRETTRRCPKRASVRLAALLTYEMLGGERLKEGEVKRRFKPVNHLDKTANAILLRGLQGSRFYGNGEEFLCRLKSEIRSRETYSRERQIPTFRREYSMLKEFNRDTESVAVAALVAVAVIAVAFGILVPERYPRTRVPIMETRQNRPQWNSDASALASIVETEADSINKENPGPAIEAEQPATEAEQESSSSVETVQEVTEKSELESSPEVNRAASNPSAGERSPTRQREAGTISRGKIGRTGSGRPARSRLTDLDVKLRLIQLWRKSLQRSEKPRGWSMYSNFNKRNRAAYTSGREP